MYSIFVFNIFLIIFKVATAQNSNISPSLTISPAIVAEGNSQTLTCTYSGSGSVSEIQWRVNTVTAGFFTVSGVSCQALLIPNATLYSYTCDVSSTIFTLTIKSVRRTNRHDQWECSVRVPFISTINLTSNVVKPETKVFITSVSMKLPQTSIVTIQENTPQQFRCVTSGGLPEPTVKWYKGTNGTNNDDEITSSIVTSYSYKTDGLVITTSSLTFAPAKDDNDISIYCSAFTADQTPRLYTRKLKLNILYGPDGAPSIQGYTDGATYRVIENKPGHLTCLIRGGNPLPTLTWNCYSTGISDTADADTVSKTVRWTVRRGLDRSCTCHSTHITGNGSVTISVRILYPPSTPIFRYWNTTGHVIHTQSLNVIQDDTFKVACISDANPDPDVYQWDSRGNNQLLTVSSITADQTDHKYECTVMNSMRETVPVGTNPTIGTASSILTIHVMYPPSSPILYYRYGQGSLKSLTGSFRKIEGNAEPVTVICNSSSEPRPTFSWNGTLTSHSAMLTLANIDRSKAGNYICSVENEMTRTFGNPEKVVRGRNDGSFSLQILYPPVVGDLENRSIAEGDSLAVSCPVIVGNPPETTFKWTNSSGGGESRTQTLTIDKVSRNDAKFFYTCEVENSMQQTGKQQAISKPDRKRFHLNVWYAATVIYFYVNDLTGEKSVTVNETGTVHFKCNVDSNPESDMEIQNKTNGKILTSDTNSKSLEYKLNAATCFDAGFYTCRGVNQYNIKMSVKQLRLFVNCSPRQFPFIQLNKNITSARHAAATFTFTALAYPEPKPNDFKWFKWDISQWVSLSNNVAYQINTADLQSNLTVNNVNRTSYGMYRLTVRNTVGYYEQIFHLLPEDKPDDPTDIELVQNLFTETSFTVRWKPGYDYGLDQVFILKYRKTSDHVWNIVYIPDTGKSQMNYTISGLSSGTNYQVVMYASNKLGNTSETDAIIVRTKDGQNECSRSNDSNTAIIVGVVLGFAVVVLAIYSSYVTLLLKRKNGIEKQTTSSRSMKNAKNMPIYANVMYSPNDIGNQQCTDLSESGASEYTTLEKQSRDDKATYDVLC